MITEHVCGIFNKDFASDVCSEDISIFFNFFILARGHFFSGRLEQSIFCKSIWNLTDVRRPKWIEQIVCA